MSEGREPLSEVVAAAFEPVGKAVQALGESANWSPVEGSPADRESKLTTARWDKQVLRERRGPVELLSATAITRIVFIGDCLRSIATLARSPGRRPRVDFASLVAGRATLEAAAFLYWLVEPGIDSGERVRRLAVDVVHDLRMKKSTLDRLSTVHADISGDIETVEDLLTLYEVPFQPGDSHGELRDPPKLDGPRMPRVIDVLEPLMPSKDHPELGTVIYYLLSNFAHASVQGLVGSAGTIAGDGGGGMQISFSREQALATLAPSLWCLPTPIGAVLDYYGWEQDGFRETFAASAERLADWHE